MAKYRVEVLMHRTTTEIYSVVVEANSLDDVILENIPEESLEFQEAIDAEPHEKEISNIVKMRAAV